MKLKVITLFAVSFALFLPVAARACDGAGASNASGTGRHHHWMADHNQAGAGQGLNNGVNLSLDQSQQNHNKFRGKDGKNWDHKKHDHISS